MTGLRLGREATVAITGEFSEGGRKSIWNGAFCITQCLPLPRTAQLAPQATAPPIPLTHPVSVCLALRHLPTVGSQRHCPTWPLLPRTWVSTCLSPPLSARYSLSPDPCVPSSEAFGVGVASPGNPVAMHIVCVCVVGAGRGGGTCWCFDTWAE